MGEGTSDQLTPDEAGALVTQWAEHRSVTVEELAERLHIDSRLVESLVNRSRGRLSMEKWRSQNRPASGPAGSYAPAALVSAACLLIGGLVGHFLASGKGAPPFHALPVTGGQHIGLKSGLTLGGIGSMPAPGPGLTGRTLPMPSSSGRVGKMGTPRTTLTLFDNERNVVTYNLDGGKPPSGIRVPDDVTLMLRTPGGLFVSRGKKSANVAAAQSLDANRLLPGLRRLMSYALSIAPPVDLSHVQMRVAEPQLVLELGNVERRILIQWTIANKKGLEAMFADPITDDTRAAIQPFLELVHRTGKGLFTQVGTSHGPGSLSTIVN